jgi:WD40 repeat protein
VSDYGPAFAFSPDGKFIAVSDGNNVVAVFSRDTGWPVRLLRDVGRVFEAVFSPDRTVLATYGQGEWRVRLWDVATGKEMAGEIKLDKRGPIITFSPDGKVLAIHQGGEVVLWDVKARAVKRCFDASECLTQSVFVDGGKVLRWCSPDGLICDLEVNSGKLSARGPRLKGVRTCICPPRISYPWTRLNATGTHVAVLDAGTLSVWSTKAPRQFWSMSVRDGAYALAISPDGRLIALESGRDEDRWVRVWDVRSKKEVAAWRQGKPSINNLAFSPDGRTIAGLAKFGTLRLWDAASGRDLNPGRGQGMVSRLMFSDDGGRVVTGYHDCDDLFVWEARTGQLLRNFRGLDKETRQTAFSPKGAWLATASMDGLVRLWDVRTGRMRDRLSFGREVHALRVFTGGREVIGATRSHAIQWEVDARRSLGMPLPTSDWARCQFVDGGCREEWLGPEYAQWVFRRKEPVRFLMWKEGPIQFSSDGRLVLGHGKDGVAVRDAMPGRVVSRLHQKPQYLSPAWGFSPDGRVVATQDWSGHVHIKEAHSGQRFHTFTGHTGHCVRLQFSPDSSVLASGGLDGAVLLWDVWGKHDKALAALPKTRAGREAIWTGLAGEAKAAYSLMCRLQRASDGTVRLFEKRLVPVDASANQVAKLLEGLASDDFEERELSSQRLERLGHLAIGPLTNAKRSTDLEVRRRAERLLEQLSEGHCPPHVLRDVRAIGVLERIGTQRAIRLLRKLATGHPDARQTREALAACDRLNKARR